MTRFAVLALAAMLMLSACAAPGRPSPQDRPGMFGGGRGGTGGYDRAVQLYDQGRYDQALPILRCLAAQGQGFEIAQFMAGHAALQLASDPAGPVPGRDALRQEGLERLTLAAEAGWPAAQAGLAQQYAALDTTEAHALAARWAAVYRLNARDAVYGVDRLDDGIERRIASRIDPELAAEMERRAGNFAPTAMIGSPASPACAPHLGPSDPSRALRHGIGVEPSTGNRRRQGGGGP